jgi:hypothetical protein
MKSDRESAIFSSSFPYQNSCSVCKNTYDVTSNKPYCLMPCGCSSFCHKCVKNFSSDQCPKCKNRFNQFIPDYGLLDLIKDLANMKMMQKKSVVESSQSSNASTTKSNHNSPDYFERNKVNIKPKVYKKLRRFFFVWFFKYSNGLECIMMAKNA